MFLPIGDTPNPRGVPWVTYLLIGVNIALFLFVSLPLQAVPASLDDPLLLDYLRTVTTHNAIPSQAVLNQVSAYDLFTFRYGYRPAASGMTSLLSSMFLHAGWMHLAGNMLFLWIFGDNVEHRLGRIRFLFAYLATGVAATLFFALFVPHSQIPLVGASGAISGVLGFYYLWFPRNKVKTFIFLFPFVMGTYLIPARFVLGFFLVVDNLIPFVVNGGGGTGVAHGAHVGGFLAGFGLGWVGDRTSLFRGGGRRGASRAKVSSEGGEDGGGGDVAELKKRVAREDFSPAASVYRLLGRGERRRIPSGILIRLGEGLLDEERVRESLAVFRQFIADRPADPLLDRALLGAGNSMLRSPRQIVAAYQYFLEALDVSTNPDVISEARLHIGSIERLAQRR